MIVCLDGFDARITSAQKLVFASTDITCNGKLSKPEVQAAYFKFFGHFLSDEDLEDLFRRVDRKQTGFIEYGEFVVATMNETVLLGRNKLEKAVSNESKKISVLTCFSAMEAHHSRSFLEIC